MAQLHARGLMHGDLYAHNLLRAGDRVWLSDFGAAAFLPPAQPGLHAGLRALDVRAFGVLLAEWLARVPADGAQALGALSALQARCLAATADSGIGFGVIADALSIE